MSQYQREHPEEPVRHEWFPGGRWTRTLLYTLDQNGEPVAEPDEEKWARWFETADRHVARETIGDSDISTVFLGVDHAFHDGGRPIVWETMIFGGELDQEQKRCGGAREEARAMHAAMVERVRKAKPL